MITCLIIKISTNLFSIKYYTAHQHTVATVDKNFFGVLSAQTVLQIEKRAEFQVVANLSTVIKSVSKYEQAIIAKKSLG